MALDTGGPEAARRWIEAAHPEHPSLVDVGHVCDELLGFVNVPSSVWIDEEGMIVRPAEPAWPGSTPVLDWLPSLDEELPPERAGTAAEIRKMHIDPERSLRMLEDWVEHGAASPYALSPDEVVARSRPRRPEAGRAAAHFELGQHLFGLGDHDGAAVHWRAAHRLQPDNWTYKRQAWNLEAADSVGPSRRYEGGWLEDVRATGAANYYPPLEP